VYNELKTCKLIVENLTTVKKKNVCSSALTTGQRAWVNSRTCQWWV